EGHEAGVAPARNQDPLDPDGVRRGPEQGDGHRRPRDGRLSREPEDGAHEPVRGLLAGLHDDQLRRDAGGERPQGRALHGAEEPLPDVMRRWRGPALGLLALAVAGWPAPGPAAEPLRAVTTTTDLRALVEVLGDAEVRAESLLG